MSAVVPTEFGLNEHDLLVVGAGGLGYKAARQWHARFPSATVVCVTWTTTRHAALAADGLVPILATAPLPSAPYVLFSAPPGRQSDDEYIAGVARAAAAAGTRFVYTSATSVYVDVEGEVVREDSPLGNTARARRMLAAEAAAKTTKAKNGAPSFRLAMLYERARGLHELFIRRGVISTVPGTVFNVVHYEDAASAAVAALLASAEAGNTFIVCDGTPVTPEEMVAAAIKHPMYQSFEMPRSFPGEMRFKKVVDGSSSWQRLGWQPKWSSFQSFFEEDAKTVQHSIHNPRNELSMDALNL